MKKNYQQELENILRALPCEAERKSLLLHICCAPCGSYVLEYLSAYFDITLFYYNPNIHPRAEYERRLREIEKLLKEAPFCKGIELICGEYDEDRWFTSVKGLEQEREGGARCTECFNVRLEKTAALADKLGKDFFCTTLTISPHKNAELINEIGNKTGEKHNAVFLPSDFKKKDGYKRSIELCEKYGIYRQNYCGCTYSMWFNEK